MNRTVLLAALAALTAATALAEVSVDRVRGEVKPFFAPGDDGPWGRVRSEVPAHDVLNVDGDGRGDGWPQVQVNAATDLPEIAWSSGGVGDVHFAAHTGAAWASPVNLSESSVHSDDLVVFTSDDTGARFFAWSRSRAERNAVAFVAMSRDGVRLGTARELSNRSRALSRPAIAVVGDVIYVAYEEAASASDPRPVVALDEIRPPRDAYGHLDMAGEIPADIIRRCTYATHLSAGQPADVALTFDGPTLWLSWNDAPDVGASAEVLPVGCGTPILRSPRDAAKMPTD